MAIYRTLIVKCPYCGNEFRYQHDFDKDHTALFGGTSRQLIICDVEDTPGCDQYFVLELTLKPEIKTRRIETDASKDNR